jgi:hypothetical protein
MLHQVCEQAEGATLTFLLHRMSPLLAPSGESQGGEFTSAFGGVAEVHGRTA